jgi:hypothetical protein
MTREEHLQWCKDRAMEYVEREDYSSAIASMGTDLNLHPQTRDHAGIQLGVALLMIGKLNTYEEALEFIQGFH